MEMNENLKVTSFIDDKEISKLKISDKLYFRYILCPDGRFLEIRKYYKGYPSKNSYRISIESIPVIIEYLKNILSSK